MSLSERLKLAMAESNVSQAELARACKVKPPSVNGWLSGKSRFLRGENLLSAARALRVSQDWLATGKGIKKPPDNSGGQPSPVEPGDEFVPVERVNIRISAGISGFRVEHIDGNGPPVFFRRDWIDSKHYRADRLIAVKVEGGSMEPGLYPDDLVVINMEDTTPKDGAVIAANYEGEFIIKRLRRDAGEWFLTSDNQDKRRYPDKKCDEHAEIIGRVVYKQSEQI